jgi:hypothetical protein
MTTALQTDRLDAGWGGSAFFLSPVIMFFFRCSYLYLQRNPTMEPKDVTHMKRIRAFLRQMVLMLLSVSLVVIATPSFIVGRALLHNPSPAAPPFPVLAQRETAVPRSCAGPVQLGWVTDSSLLDTPLNAYQGLNVVSPTWAVIGKGGSLTVSRYPSTVQRLHQQNLCVWGRLIIDPDRPDMIHAVLSQPSVRERMAIQVARDARLGHWDGVNIDIENVAPSDRALFSAFAAGLSRHMHAAGLRFSVDIPPDVKSGNNRTSPFDHAALGQVCDHVVLMGYDQHWSTDPEPGPVTSMPWLDDAVRDLLETGVPPSKIVLGLPAYTRVWLVNGQGRVLQNAAYAFHVVEQWLQQSGPPLHWDPQLGEYDATYPVPDGIRKIWLANVRSLRRYTALAGRYHLAGTAVWSLNLIRPAEWNQIFATSG